MIFHPVVVVKCIFAAGACVAAAPHVWSLAVRFWNWLCKVFSMVGKPAVPWSMAASVRRVCPNGGWFEFCFSWQKGGAPPSQPPPAAPLPASTAPPQLDLRSNSDSALPVPASLLPLIVGN